MSVGCSLILRIRRDLLANVLPQSALDQVIVIVQIEH